MPSQNHSFVDLPQQVLTASRSSLHLSAPSELANVDLVFAPAPDGAVFSRYEEVRQVIRGNAGLNSSNFTDFKPQIEGAGLTVQEMRAYFEAHMKVAVAHGANTTDFQIDSRAG